MPNKINKIPTTIKPKLKIYEKVDESDSDEILLTVVDGAVDVWLVSDEVFKLLFELLLELLLEVLVFWVVLEVVLEDKFVVFSAFVLFVVVFSLVEVELL